MRTKVVSGPVGADFFMRVWMGGGETEMYGGIREKENIWQKETGGLR